MYIAIQLIGLLGLIIMAFYAYRGLLYAYAVVRRPRALPETTTFRRYGILISARNEEAVIGALIESLLQQNYPADHIEVFVCADNCSDRTAAVARAAGATVFERHNLDEIGKGYALDYLFRQLRRTSLDSRIDAWIVFDADNIVDRGYVRAINRAHVAGADVLTTCRASKNYDDNWLSAGYSCGFMHDALFLNEPKSRLGLSAAISGTGFMVASHIIRHFGGWPFHSLTEDIEFTCALVTNGFRISYCHDAIFYDEQPTSFPQSCRQRLRWAKGTMQVFGMYAKPLLTTAIRNRDIRSLEILSVVSPVVLLMAAVYFIHALMCLVAVVSPTLTIHDVLPPLLNNLTGAYTSLVVMAVVTTILGWKRTHAHPLVKIASCITYPLYMLSYIPIYVWALFAQVQWTPVPHSVTKNLDAIQRGA